MARLLAAPVHGDDPEDKRDPGILDKLEAEGSGILNWCIEGLRRYQANGCRLAPPAKVLAARPGSDRRVIWSGGSWRRR